MEGKRLIRTIRLDNILSYGSSYAEFELEPLNVLIGPNASGKSNLIEVLSLLAAAPSGDIQTPIREGGGVRNWLWTGATTLAPATVDVTIEYSGEQPLRYRLSFTESADGFKLLEEAIENGEPKSGEDEPDFHYRYRDGVPSLAQYTEDQSRSHVRLSPQDIVQDQSILSQRTDSNTYPELSHLAKLFGQFIFYRELNLGRMTPPRLPQEAAMLHDMLLDDASNIGPVLGNLLNQPPVKREIVKRLKAFHPTIEDLLVGIQTNMVQISLHEERLNHHVPATRLSDGTLRYLCLLAVLCNPEPPPVVCIEEPEIGLHPDVIPEVADLLVEASSRSQIFVTTHSDILIDALTETPEAVIVCEKSEGATQLKRIDAKKLRPWLEKYQLGELWVSGEIGGNRW